jgi:MFS family permease
MAILGVPMMLGPILGPLLGGWLVQAYTWRLIFYINLPIGLVGALLAILFLERGRDVHAAREPLDVFGLILVSPAVVGIVYGLSQPDTYGWGSWQTLGPLLGGALLLIAFVLFELRQRFPLIEIRVFKDYAFSAAVAVMFLVVVALFGAVFMFPLFLQQIQGYGTLESGFLLAFQGIAAAAMMPIAGTLVDRIGARKIVPFGVVILTAATIWTTTISYDTSKGVIIGMMLARGVGMGFTMMPSMSSAYVTMAPQLISRATSVTNVIQRVGSALGVAIMATILTNRISANMPAIPGHAAVGGNTSSIASLSLPAPLKTVILQQATRGFDSTFWVGAGLGMLCFPAAFLLQRALKGREVRDYAVKQIEEGVLLGTAAQRVRQGAGGRIQGQEAETLFASLAGAAKGKLQRGLMMMRMGSNAGGMVPPALRSSVSPAGSTASPRGSRRRACPTSCHCSPSCSTTHRHPAGTDRSRLRPSSTAGGWAEPRPAAIRRRCSARRRR